MQQSDGMDLQQLRRVVDVLPRAIVVTELDGTILLWNEQAERLYGWPEAEVRGRSILEVMGDPDPAEGARVLEALQRGETARTERAVARRDGTVVQVVAVIRALLGTDGQIEAIVGASEDVTQVAELEREAQRLADHLTLALDAGGFGTWRWDLATGRTVWDERMEQVAGFAPGTFDGTFETWAATIHPDDAPGVLASVEAAVEAKGAYRVEHRILTPDGDVRWIEGAGRVLVDDDGRVVGTIGCAHDVSDRVASQQERERLIAETRDSMDRERIQRERLELMAAVNEALEEADELPEVLRSVAAAVVPRLGDWCSLHVLPDPASSVPVVETAHVDPAMVAFARELQERYPFDPDAPTGVAHVIRTGQSEFYPEITDDVIDAADPTEEQRDLVRELRLRSAIAVPLRKQGQVLGAMQFVMTDEHRRYTEEDLALAQAVAGRVASSLDNRLLREQRDHIARIDARLAELGRGLAGVRGLEVVERVVADLALGVLEVDGGEVGLLADAEHVRILHPTPSPGHGGEGGRALEEDLIHIDLQGPSPMARALRDGEIVFIEQVEVEPDAEMPEGGAVIASPLFDDDRRTMGALVFEWAHPRRFTDLERDTVETVSRLCGQALRRAQLVRQTEELASIAASFAVARTSEEVALLLRDHASAALGAMVTTLRTVDAESSLLRPIVDSDLPGDLARRFERVRIEDNVPSADAAREDRAIWLPDRAAYRDAYPETAAATASGGMGAVAAIPLHRSDGTVIAVAGLAWPAAMRFDAPFRTRMLTLCDLAAQTLERARLYESEHALVASMQRQLLGQLPEVPGVELAAFYEPAAAAIGMGGDWYVTVPLDDGTLVALLGDIVGHGVEAVADMARLQQLVASLVRAGMPLGDVLARANDMVSDPDPIWGTALLLHVDPAQGRLGYACAGHPWPLVRDPSGTVHQLDGCQHPMMGLPIEPAPLTYVDLAPGSVVLAYTDGLIERRDETITDGIDRLAGCLAGCPIDGELPRALEQLVAVVHDPESSATATTDDIAALAIRTSPPG